MIKIPPVALIICFYILCLLRSSGIAGENQKARIAVLDLEAPEQAPWLGPAISEALRTKLAGAKNIHSVERTRIRELMLTKQDGSPSADLYGASHLFVGRVQLVGEWPNGDARIRVHARVVASSTSKIIGNAAFTVDGTLGTLFDLESRLAERFIEAVGIEPELQSITYHESTNLQSKEFFGKALYLYQSVEEKTLRKEASLAESDRQAQRTTLHEAVALFRQAQNANAGVYYSKAHRFEGEARSLLATLQPDENQAKTVRAETIRQFRQDAAEASAAFFDLGVALQVNGNYAEAVDAFSSHLRWMEGKFHAVRWEKKFEWCATFGPEDAGLWPSRAIRHYAQRWNGKLYLLEMKKEPYANALVCLDESTGEELWRNATTLESLKPRMMAYQQVLDSPNSAEAWLRIGAYVMSIVDGMVYLLVDETLVVLDAKTGEEIKRLSAPFLDKISSERYQIRLNQASILIHPKDHNLICVFRNITASSQDQNQTETDQVLVLDTQSDNVRWQQEAELLSIWNGVVYVRPIKKEKTTASKRHPSISIRHLSDRIPLDLYTGKPTHKGVVPLGRYATLISTRSEPDIAYEYDLNYLQIEYSKTFECKRWQAGETPKQTDALQIQGKFFVNREPDNGLIDPVPWYCWDSKQQRMKLVRFPSAGLYENLINIMIVTAWESSPNQRRSWLYGDLILHRRMPPDRDGFFGIIDLHHTSGKRITSVKWGDGAAMYVLARNDTVTVCHLNTLRSLKINPPYAGPHSEVRSRLYRAQALLETGSIEKALEDVKYLRMQNAGNPECEMLAGQIFHTQGKTAQSLNAYHRAYTSASSGSAIREVARAHMEELMPIYLTGPEISQATYRCERMVASLEVFDDLPLLYLAWSDKAINKNSPDSLLFNIASKMPQVRLLMDSNWSDAVTTARSENGLETRIRIRCKNNRYLGNGLFIDKATKPEHASYFNVGLYNAWKNRIENETKHYPLPGYLPYLGMQRPQFYQHGVFLWERLSKSTQGPSNYGTTSLCVTDVHTGELLWNCEFLDPPISRGCKLVAGNLLVLDEPKKGKAWRLRYMELKTGRVLWQRNFPVDLPDGTTIQFPFILEKSFYKDALAWNGLILLQDNKNHIFWCDLDTGAIGHFPKELLSDQTVENNLRGEARSKALANPEEYLKAYPEKPSRFWLGDLEKSAYIQQGKLYDREGKGGIDVHPIFQYAYLPARTGEFLVFCGKDNRLIVVKIADYLDTFGVDPKTHLLRKEISEK